MLPSPCHDLVAVTVKPMRDYNASPEWFPVKHETAIRSTHGVRVVHEQFHRIALSTLCGVRANINCRDRHRQ